MAKGLKIPSAHQAEDTGETTTTEEIVETAPGGETSEGATVSAAPQAQVVSPRVAVAERLVRVKPRITKESFRCNGRYWTTIANKEMMVPPGVAEHMQRIGVL